MSYIATCVLLGCRENEYKIIVAHKLNKQWITQSDEFTWTENCVSKKKFNSQFVRTNKFSNIREMIVDGDDGGGGDGGM